LALDIGTQSLMMSSKMRKLTPIMTSHIQKIKIKNIPNIFWSKLQDFPHR